jgi:uncharacterized damage-inducible protein DinB
MAGASIRRAMIPARAEWIFFTLLLSKESRVSAIRTIESEFNLLHENLIEVLELIPADRLYWRPFESASFVRVYSCGELISHVGGLMEYSFNGITSNFWEEPFEWTTREALPNQAAIREYLEEVARVRRVAFDHLTDSDLSKQLFYPNATATSVGEILITTLTHAAHHRGQVYAYVHLFSGEKLPSTSARARY